MASQLIPKALPEHIAQRFKTLSEPIRLSVIEANDGDGEMSVMRLVEAAGHQRANVSKHLTFNET